MANTQDSDELNTPKGEPVAYRYKMPVEDDHWVWNYQTYYEPTTGVDYLYTHPAPDSKDTEALVESMPNILIQIRDSVPAGSDAEILADALIAAINQWKEQRG